MVELKNISFSYGALKVLEDFNLTVNAGESICLWGKSGSGKTTVLKLILGLIKSDSGSVSAPDKISCVFQEDRLIPSLSALENVALVSNRESAAARLGDLGLSDSLDLLPEELSGGMKRRVAVARALEFGGDILLLDEAFSGLEDALAKQILEKILKEFEGRLVVAVTHRPELFADREYNEIKL